jgi:hypothetical protein
MLRECGFRSFPATLFAPRLHRLQVGRDKDPPILVA